MQNLICGTDALVVDGDMVEGTRLAQQAADRHGWFHAAQPYNLYRIEGKKTLAFEIAEALGWRAPDRILIPTGGGTNVLALNLGFSQLIALGWVDRMPALDRGTVHRLRTHRARLATQRAGPPLGALHLTRHRHDPPVPARRRRGGAHHARHRRSRLGGGGTEDSFAAARWLARHEGLFLQPAAAAPAACLMTGKPAELGQHQVVIGIGTGSGKNQVTAALGELPEAPRIPPDLATLEAALAQ